VSRGNAAPLTLGANVHLPAGVLITEVTIDYYDAAPSGNPAFLMQRISATGNPTNVFPLTTLDFAGGDIRLAVVIDPPEVVDNQTNTYALIMVLATPSQAFHRATIKYRRQVSPAPAVATFGDVPLGHPQHQYIEALVLRNHRGVRPRQLLPRRAADPRADGRV